MKVVANIYGTKPLTTEEVIKSLTETFEKLVISNGKTISQISWAPDNNIEIITVRIKNMTIQNHIFTKFNGIETINWIRQKSYKGCEFYYGYIKD